MTAWRRMIAIVIALVLLLPGWVQASPPTGQAPAATVPQKKSGGPVSREAYYSMTFINNGPAEITLDHVGDACMYDAGPRSIYVPSYGSANISLSDDNHFRFRHNCSDQPKWVLWTVHPVTEKGNVSPYNIKFRHVFFESGELNCIVSAFFCTTIEAPHGQSSGNGLVTSANCGSLGCLNTWVPDPGNLFNNITIYFDGSYDGTKQPAVITSPAQHAAIHGDSPFYASISGTATPDTQVNVTAKAHTESPWADDGGNWVTDAVYHFNTGQVFSATVTSAVEGTYTSNFISVPPVVINGPASPVDWSSTITVTGTALPGATVVARSDPQNPDAPACSGTADGSGAWSCGLVGLDAGNDYNLTAWQQGHVDVDGGWDWLDPVQAQWPLHVNAFPLVITSPPNGGHIDGDAPPYRTIFGTGTPGGQVVIDTPYSVTRPVTVTIDGNGNWTTDPVFRFPPTQSYQVPASQTVNGESAPGATTVFDSWPSLKIVSPPNRTMLPSNQTSLVMNGTGVPGGTATPSPVTPKNGATPCAPAPIAADGTWTCAITNLTPAYYGVAMQQSKAGQYDGSVPLVFTVAQPVAIDEPIPGQSYPSQTTSVVFKGQGQPGASLKVDVPGASPCGNQVIAGSGLWSCQVSGLQPGKSYTATVTQGSSDQIQTAGSWIDPGVTRQFSVSGFGALTISVPSQDQVFPSATSTINASGQAQPGAQLQVNVPGAEACAPQTVGPAPGNWQCQVSGLQAGGTYQLTATQTVAGVSDDPKHANFAVAAPVSILVPRENQILPAANVTVDVSGTAQPNASIAVTASPAQPCGTTADGQGRWRCTVTGLAAGTSYTANVTQSGTGWQDPPAQRHFSVAASAGVSIATPRDKSVVSSNNPVDGMQVAGAGQSGAVVKVTVGTAAQPPADIVNGAWATDPISLSAYGANGATLPITATEYVDDKPNGSANINVTVAKVATVAYPQDEQEIQDIGNVTVRGQGQEGARITVNNVDAAGSRKGCVATVSGGAWSCVLNGIMPASSYTLSVVQSGQASEWTDQPVGRAFRTRAARPVAYTSPAPSGGMPADTPYDVAGTGEPNAEIHLKLMGVHDLGFSTVEGDGSWDFPNLLLSRPGCYSLTATQVLNGYYLDQGSIPYPVGGATCPGGPGFYITVPMPDQILAGQSYTVQGYGTPGNTVTLKGGPPCQALVQPDGSWSCGPYALAGRGTYSVTAQQVQTSQQTAPRRFSVIDPVIITSPQNGALLYWNNSGTIAPPPTSVSGTATPGSIVEVSQTGGSGDTQYATASADGTWTTAAVFLPPPPRGGNCTIWGCTGLPATIRAWQIYDGDYRDAATITIVGTFFVGSGQQGR